MTKKFQNTISKYGYPLGAIAVILIIWQLLFMSGLIPAYKLPAPIQVIKAFINDFPLLMRHMGTTLYEAITGLLLSLVLSFLLSALMDRFGILYKTAYPLVIITQTVPVIAIAPLLIAWLGYGVTPKIVLIMLVCFFPVTIGLLDAFRSCDKDTLNLMRAMGASKLQIFYHVKLPSALGNFFA
ncbi:MAG: ABC transporter permease subunit, partial [Clostridiales bacterium]|nr:ABC transporter permease subunit [Clostridiales bacterium]